MCGLNPNYKQNMINKYLEIVKFFHEYILQVWVKLHKFKV